MLNGMLNGDGFKANETRWQTTGTTSVSTCRPAYCFRRTSGKSVLGTKVLRNAVSERTANFGWPAVQQVRDLCVYLFLSWSFLLLPIFSSFSNNAARHDLPNRQSVSPVLSSPVQSSPVQSVSQSVSQSGNKGFTTISLSSNLKNSLGVRHSFLCNNLLHV